MRLSAEQPAFLRSILEEARRGLLEDLALHRERLRDPGETTRRALDFERLLGFLDGHGRPADRGLLEPLAELARVIDEANEYERVAFEHAAFDRFLVLLRDSVGDNTLRL